MNDILPDSFFRKLDPTEVESFKQWARDNHSPGDEVSPVWHPVVREECRLMDLEESK